MLDKNLLCISALNGQIKAAATRKGQILEQWEGPQTNNNYSGFAGIIKEALAKTGKHASQAALVLAHPNLSHQVVEIPPVKGSTLERVLSRQAQKLKAFPTEAVWSSQPALPIKKMEAALLNLCPKALLDPLSNGAQQNGLQLARVIPTTSVLIGQLKALPLGKDEIGLLAAETGQTTTLVIGRKDGRVCLGRVLLNHWNKSADQVAAELSRSIGFAEQQSGLTVTRAWLFGEGAAAQLPALQSLLKLPVELSPVEYTPTYWLEQAAKLPEKEDGNLISLQVREAPKRQKFLNWTALMVLLVVLIALGTVGVVEKLRRNELAAVQKAKAQIQKLNLEQVQLEQSLAELEAKEKVIRVVSEEKLPPVPDWFLAFLGEAVPDDLVLTQLHITRTNQLWQVQLKGVGQAPDIKPAFLTLSNQLASGSFHLRMTRCECQGLEAEPLVKPSVSRLVKNSAPPPPPRTDLGVNQFIIEGQMQ